MSKTTTPHDAAPHDADPTPPPARTRRWPRRLAIGVAAFGIVLAGAYWYLGRETTLRVLAQKVADVSGGQVAISGITGSLYDAMHIDRMVYRSPERVITVDNIDIEWSPWQYLKQGIAISKLYAVSVKVHALRDGAPAKLPTTLAAPFVLAINDGRAQKITFTSAAPGSAATVIGDLRFKLAGDQRAWELRQLSAVTPWGLAAASAKIDAARPFKLSGSASMTQFMHAAGQKTGTLEARFGGDLVSTIVNATALSGSGKASGAFTLAPFEPLIVRALTVNGSDIDPSTLHAALPKAKLDLALSAQIDARRNVAGKIDLVNKGPAGTLDQQRLPLRALHGELGGTLAALRIGDVLIDLGAAGKFTGTGSLNKDMSTNFVLHTDRLDLKGLHGRMKKTAIAGDIKLASAGGTQTLVAQLADGALRLDADAVMDGKLLTLRQARIGAGASSVRLSGSATLAERQPFELKASAASFNPAAFGDYPKADINLALNASGVLSPAWQLAADFALRPSRLFDQPLSGKGKFKADAKHISGVAANLALGQNTIALAGSFGAPGERLTWRAEGKQLALARSDLYGVLVANGVVTGTMDAPRTSFVLDANGVGWSPAARAANNSTLRASGEAWLADKVVNLKATGKAERFNPAAFGFALPGSINGNFDASGRLGPAWRAALKLDLQPSTLSNAPLWGHAALVADAKRVSNADLDLHVGPNVASAKGSFGAPGDTLAWRLDATHLAALGPDFSGALRGSGTLSGTMQAPAVAAALEGQNLRFGLHSVKSVRASANLGSGRGAADPLVSDIALTEYVNGARRIAAARLVTSGTRGAHTLKLAATGEAFDASGEVAGGWSGDSWSGSVGALQNKGLFAFTLQGPVPLRISAAPGAGLPGLLRPARVEMQNAVFRLPNGSISVQSLDKNGARWTSKGSAAGVPLNYLAQFSPDLRENFRGDLTLGAQWSLDMHTPPAGGAAPSLNGMLHVFREKGDLIAGAEVPVALGLSLFDLRADVANGALRAQLAIDGTRAGKANVDATAQLVAGRLAPASALRMRATADMGSIAWLAPLTGQPALELDGLLKLDVSGTGTLGNPLLNGTVSGDKLALRWAEQGVKLRNGQLRAQLVDDRVLLERLSFEGNQGTAVASGSVRFERADMSVDLKLVADKLELLSRPDRTLVLSGQSSLTRDAKRFLFAGKFRADRALIELAPLGRPTMSDDVIVLGRARPGSVAKAAPALPLNIDLEADLGEFFKLRGMGIDAMLAGTVHVRATGARPPRVTGSIRVNEGTYAAYGQKLAIERGVLNFTGAYDNPGLNIRAMRKQAEGEQLSETNVEAGVEVRGTALAPAAKLVSTPSVPDSEKLSWLVLGHGIEGVSGNEASVLSAAAGALLGGSGGGFQSRLANSLGVDELGLSQAAGLESTVVTVGKRISQRAYLSFEQGATTASSMVRLRYKLNSRLTLQFQTGTNTALDLLYSWNFD
ncbi:MAG: translocation/assembly module TamB domain-containing protein [Pseudomonadota bacterium]